MQSTVEKLNHQLDGAVIEWKWWQQHHGKGAKSRFARFLKAPLLFARLQISKIIPVPQTAQLFWGEPLKCYWPDYFYTTVFGLLKDSSEVGLTRFLINHLQPGDTFLDIGASVGFYSLLSAQLITEGQIHAFEPTPATFNLLQQNTTHHPQIHLHQLAVGETSGTAQFHLSSKVSVKNSLQHRRSTTESISVSVTTLDQFCMEKNIVPSFIKIDVEGAEPDVIAGGMKTLTTHQPLISLEMRINKNEPHIRASLHLIKLGYRAYALNLEGQLQPLEITQEDVARVIGKDSIYTNLIFSKQPLPTL